MNQNPGYGQSAAGSGQFTDTSAFSQPAELTPELQQRLKDPFDNPTEYHKYSDDYSKVLPWLKLPEYKIPFEPARTEKQMLKRSYSIGGACVLLNFLSVSIAAVILMLAIGAVIKAINPSVSFDDIENYFTSSSLMVSLNMLLYLLANVLFAKVGLKWAKLSSQPMLKPENGFNWKYAFQYCLIGLFLWIVSAVLATGAEYILDALEWSVSPPDIEEDLNTPLGIVITTVYSCIIAPITEEIFYRGMVMKVLSKSSQRFAIFASAMFFGLGHGNVAQFILAFLLGIFMAHIDLKHNSILPSIIVHMFINTFVTITNALSDNAAISGIWFLAIIVGAIIGFVLLIVFRRNDKLPATTPAQTRRGFAVAKNSVAFIASVIVLSVVMVINTIAS